MFVLGLLSRRSDPHLVGEPEIVQGLLQFQLEALCPTCLNADGELDSHAQVVARPELRQEPGPKTVPHFGRHGSRELEPGPLAR